MPVIAETDMIWMTLLVVVPSIFALGLIAFPRTWQNAMCWWSLAGTAVTLGISIAIFINFKLGVIDLHSARSARPRRRGRPTRSTPAAQKAEQAAERWEHAAPPNDYVGRYDWIKRFNIEYFLGIDGISLPLILLTTFLCFLSMIASFNIKRYDSSERFVRGYCMLFLVLETGMLGTFVALDFFLFYIFWEMMLLPMYFLIGIWGGPRREYAAIKFFLYTLLGSVFILVAMLGFYFTNMRDFVSPSVVAAEADRLRRRPRPRIDRGATRAGEGEQFRPDCPGTAGRGALQYLGNDKDAIP